MKEEKKKKQEEIKKEKLESNYNCISSMNFNFGAQVTQEEGTTEYKQRELQNQQNLRAGFINYCLQLNNSIPFNFAFANQE